MPTNRTRRSRFSNALASDVVNSPAIMAYLKNDESRLMTYKDRSDFFFLKPRPRLKNVDGVVVVDLDGDPEDELQIGNKKFRREDLDRLRKEFQVR